MTLVIIVLILTAFFIFIKKGSKNKLLLKYSRLGNEARDNEDYEKAILYYQKVIEIQPNEYMYTGIGMAYLSLECYDNAIEPFKHSIKINPKYSNSYLGLGYAYGFLDRDDLSIEYFKKSAQLGNSTAQETCRMQNIEWVDCI